MDPDDEIPGGIEKAEPLVHVGYEAQRVLFTSSPMDCLERVLAFRWMEENKDEWCILDRLVCTENNPRGDTQRDAEVASHGHPVVGNCCGLQLPESLSKRSWIQDRAAEVISWVVRGVVCVSERLPVCF